MSIDTWMNKEEVMSIYLSIYNDILAIKMKEVMPFVITWADLESIMLCEISQRKTNILWFHLYVQLKKIELNVNHKSSKNNKTDW